MKSIQVIQQHVLSDGDTVKVTKLGCKYNFVRLSRDDQAPYIVMGLRLDEACSLLIKELMNDNLEVE